MKQLQIALGVLLGVYIYLLIPSWATPVGTSSFYKQKPSSSSRPMLPVLARSDQDDPIIDATVLFQPEHLMSATGSERIGLIVMAGGAVSDQVLSDLQTRTALVTYPEEANVPASVTIRNNTAYKLVNDRLAPRSDNAYVDVTPLQPLGDRWYELVVWDMPPTLAVLGDGLIGKKMPDGSVRSRFTPTSHPIVRALSQTVTGKGKTRVVANFSEPIDDAARAGFVFRDLSGKGQCRQTATLGASPTDAVADCDSADVTHTIDFLVGGARSRYGVGLREHVRGVETVAQQHYSVNFAKQPGDTDHREWRPD